MKPTIAYRPKRNSPKRVSDGGGVQFPLADRDQVRSRVRVSAPEKSGGSTAEGGASWSDSRERPATDYAALRQKLSATLPPSEARQLTAFLDRLDHQRKVKAAQMRRYRAKQKEGGK